MKLRLLLIPILAAVLSACASIDAGAPRATAVDPAVLGAQLTPVVWPTEHWWQRYGDAQLDALVDEALAGSPSLAVARARLAQANAAAGLARASSGGRVTGNLNATRQRYTENGAVPKPLAGSVDTDAKLSLDASIDLDFWNRNGALLDAALSQARAAQAQQQAARVLIAGTVTSSYLDLQRLFTQHQVLSAAIKQREDLLALTRQRFDAGLDTQVEVRQAESEMASARTERSRLDESIALQRNQLAALIGAAPTRGEAVVAKPLTNPGTIAPSAIPLELLGRRADVVAARWRVEASERDIDAARASFYPNVNLVGFVGLSALGLPNLLKSGSGIAGIGPAISLPIFDAGRLNANYQGRRADADLAIANYNQTVVDAVHQVADTLQSMQWLKSQTVEQRQAREAIEAAYEIALKRYRAGLGTYLTVLTAQSSVLAQQRLEADLQARALMLDADLMRNLGGGIDTGDWPQARATPEPQQDVASAAPH